MLIRQRSINSLPRWDRYEKHKYEKDLETRKEVQGFGFYKVNRKPGYASLSPERDGKNAEPLGHQHSIRGNSRPCSSPSEWGKEKAGLWDQSKPSIETFRGNDFSPFFLMRSIFFKCSFEVYFHFKFTQIKIIMFSIGLGFTVEEGVWLGFIQWTFQVLEVSFYLKGKLKLQADMSWKLLGSVPPQLRCSKSSMENKSHILEMSEKSTLRNTFSSFTTRKYILKCFKSKRTF